MSKLDGETALNEFERWTNSMDLDVDTSGMDEEDLTAFNKQKNKIIRSLELGSMIINDSGEAEYTPRNARSRVKDPIVFRERSGASLMAMDGKKKGYNVTKTYSVLADMCNVHPSVFSGLIGTDIKVCEAVFALLMD